MDFAKIAENRIEAAIEQGTFDDLPGAGRPLPPPLAGDPVEAFGFQMMARAGAIPAEIQLKKEILRKAGELKTMPAGPQKLAAMQALAGLQTRLAMMLEKRR